MNDDPWNLKHLDISDYSKEELESYIRHLEHENAALRNKLAGLENQSQWQCSRGGTDYEIDVERALNEQLERENAALRCLLRKAIAEHVDPYDLPEGDHFIARAKAMLGIPPTQQVVVVARKEAKP